MVAAAVLEQTMKQLLQNTLITVVGASIFAGLPLFGWGINNASKFFNHPAQLLYVIVIIFLQF